MKDSAFIVQTITLQDAQPSGGASNGVYQAPDTVAAIQPPASIQCTRLTIQVQGKPDYTTPGYVEIVISNNPPKSGSDGFKLTTWYDVNGGAYIPGVYSLENYQEEGITGTLYITANTPDAIVCIIYEGYYR